MKIFSLLFGLFSPLLIILIIYIVYLWGVDGNLSWKNRYTGQLMEAYSWRSIYWIGFSIGLFFTATISWWVE